jgi:GT2 family glycosyltransferase
MATLAVIVVSYNTRDLLRQALQAVLAAAPALQALPEAVALQLLVVDNASHDGSAAMVKAEFPAAALLASPENLGFTGGNNAALAALGFPVPAHAWPETLHWVGAPVQQPDFVLLLNPDTAVEPAALAAMITALRGRPMAAATGARLQFADGSFQHGAFHFPSLAQLIIDLYPVWQLPGGHRLLGSRLNGRYARALWDGTAPFPVDWALGAALMVRGDVVTAIGGLDDGYFMYCEELDWCLRMRQAGHLILAAPAARIVHHEGQSSRQAPWRSLERLWCSRFRFFEKFAARYPPGYRFWVRRIVRPAMRRRIADVRRQMAQGAMTATEGAEAIAAFQRIAAL